MTPEDFKQARITMRLSQRKLANLLSRNYRTIQRYESGDWKVSCEIESVVTEMLKKLRSEK